MNNRTLVSLTLLSLLSTASAAHATGYYVVVYNRSPGPGAVLAYQGFSTTLLNSFSSGPGIVTDIPYGNLADFNGDAIPEIVTADNKSPSVDVWNAITGAHLTSFSMGSPADFGGPITITSPTINVSGSTSKVFTYSPGGTPTPANSILDLNGDGIADSISYDAGTHQISLTNGATNAVTSFVPTFAAAPINVSIFTWTPDPALASEPASLSLLTLALPLLLKRRR